MIKGILFDLDNTLLDRTRTFADFSGKLMDSYFGHLDPSEREAYIRQVIEADEDGYRHKPDLFGELLEKLEWRTKPGIGDLMDYYNHHYVQSAVHMEHAVEVLERFKSRGLPLGLITNGRTDIQYGKIDKLQLRDYFGVILVSEEAGIKKPDKRIFQLALDRLGLAADEAVFVGDHPHNDIGGAGQAGIRGIWLQRNQPWDDSLKEAPLHRIVSLAELEPLLFA
ncbi:HAD family hydrolase [Paenibacillus chitinolyticus]|uniref:HAD family hydrolase n=1 Tax=Paenibacillus chitinolyticus TaxID=79263 RepID=UPI00365C507E